MDWIGLVIAGLQFLASVFGLAGHVASGCVNAPVAIHASSNVGIELDPHIAGAVIGSTPAC